MLPSRNEEKVHSLVSLVVVFISLILILISKNFYQMSGVWIVFLFYIKYLEVKNYSIFKVLLLSIFFSTTFFLLNMLFPRGALEEEPLFVLLGMNIFKSQLLKSLIITSKITFLTHVSMCSSIFINYTNVILNLISNKKLSNEVGYPLLVALNSITLIKDELKKIQLNARQRKFSLIKRINLLFPLMVYSIRHSQRGALSLVTRGLNSNRTFYYNYNLTYFDRKILVFVIFVELVIYMGLI